MKKFCICQIFNHKMPIEKHWNLRGKWVENARIHRCPVRAREFYWCVTGTEYGNIIFNQKPFYTDQFLWCSSLWVNKCFRRMVSWNGHSIDRTIICHRISEIPVLIVSTLAFLICGTLFQLLAYLWMQSKSLFSVFWDPFLIHSA